MIHFYITMMDAAGYINRWSISSLTILEPSQLHCDSVTLLTTFQASSMRFQVAHTNPRISPTKSKLDIRCGGSLGFCSCDAPLRGGITVLGIICARTSILLQKDNWVFCLCALRGGFTSGPGYGMNTNVVAELAVVLFWDSVFRNALRVVGIMRLLCCWESY